MDVQILPRPLRGAVTPPPSKSMAHRLLIAAALAQGESTIENIALSQDIEATLRCVEALGGSWTQLGPGALRVNGIGENRVRTPLPALDCGESGSTLRFFLPIALAAAGGGVFTGRGRLMERPQQPYFDLFAEKGIRCVRSGGALTVQGTLTPGTYRLPGNVSSQFFTGLLFALSRLEGASAVVSTTALESADYVTMTIQAMERAGVAVTVSPEGTAFQVRGQRYRPFSAAVEADWSQAGFWYAANFLGGEVELRGLNRRSAQGDMAVDALFRRLTAPGEAEIDLSPIPDLLPPLAVMAAGRNSVTRFVNAGRLRIKESDRLQSVCAMLRALGIDAEEGSESLTVRGGALRGGTVDGANDHRIVMAAAIAASRCTSPVTILGAEAVQKSYPDFFDHYRVLGGEVHVL